VPKADKVHRNKMAAYSITLSAVEGQQAIGERLFEDNGLDAFLLENLVRATGK
jgi:hypothetical protein